MASGCGWRNAIHVAPDTPATEHESITSLDSFERRLRRLATRVEREAFDDGRVVFDFTLFDALEALRVLQQSGVSPVTTLEREDFQRGAGTNASTVFLAPADDDGETYRVRDFCIRLGPPNLSEREKRDVPEAVAATVDEFGPPCQLAVYRRPPSPGLRGVYPHLAPLGVSTVRLSPGEFLEFLADLLPAYARRFGQPSDPEWTLAALRK